MDIYERTIVIYLLLHRHRYKHGVKSPVDRGSFLTPIIAKGVLYPQQNLRASKSDTRHSTKGTQMRPLCAGWDPSLPSICARANASVHIRRSEIGELAHQAQSERIFAAGEYSACSECQVTDCLYSINLLHFSPKCAIINPVDFL